MKIISAQRRAFFQWPAPFIFVGMLILGNIMVQVSAQCCLEYSGVRCTSCPVDMHLYQGNCLLNIPNCIQYENGFVCSLCNNGYQLDPITKQCVLSEFSDENVPKTGFLDLPAFEYYSPEIVAMQNATRQYLKAKGFKQEIQQTAKIYVRKATNPAFGLPAAGEDRFLRFIYYTNTGYIDIMTYYQAPKSPVPQKFVAIKQQAWDKKLDQEYIDWQNYSPAGHKKKVLEIFNTRYQALSNLQILQVFRSIKEYWIRDSNLNISEISTNSSQGEKLRAIYNFRLLLVDPNNGISAQQIPILSPDETEVLDENNIDNNIRVVLSIFNTSAEFTKYIVGTMISKLTITQDTYNVTYTHTGVMVNNTEATSFIAFVIRYSVKQVEIMDSFFFLAPVQPQFVTTANSPIFDNSTSISADISLNKAELIANNNPTTNTVVNMENNTVGTQIKNNSSVQNTQYTANNTTSSGTVSFAPLPGKSMPINTITTAAVNQTSAKIQKAINTTFTSTISRLAPRNSPIFEANNSLLPGPKLTSDSLRLSPKVLNFVNRGMPTLNKLSPDFDMVEVVNVTNFLLSKMYLEIRNVISNFRLKSFINGNLVKVCYGQNETIHVVQIMYQQLQINRNQLYYAFALHKQNLSLELLQQVTIPFSGLNSINFNDLSLEDQQAKVNPNIRFILQNVLPQDPYYHLLSKLIYARSLQFTGFFSLSSFSTNIFQRYYLKFLYPNNSYYEYIEFKFEMLDGKLESLRRLGRIFYQKQVFVPYTQQSIINSVIIPYLVSSLKSYPSNILLLSLETSKSRKDVYRAELSLSNLTNVLYQFDLKQPQTMILLSNKKINSSDQVFISNLTIVSPELKIMNQTQNPVRNLQFNSFKFFGNFPYLRYQSLWKPVPLVLSPSSNQLSIDAATSIISQFFNLNKQGIRNVIITNRQTMFSVLDSYTLEYNQYTPITGSEQNRGTFQISPLKRFTFQLPNIVQVQPDLTVTPFISSSPSSSSLSSNNKVLTVKEKDTTNVSVGSSSSKPFELLEKIFNRNISGSSGPQNNNNSMIMNSILGKAPSVIPLSYSQVNKNMHLVDLPLRDPEQPTNQTIHLLETTILNPNTYGSGLVAIQSQRVVKDDPDSVIVSLSHAYYGNSLILASLKNSSVLKIQYDNSGYLIGANDTGVILQVEQIYNTTKFLNQQISSVFKKFNYVEDKKQKIVTEQDIIYWRLKRVQNVLQYQFVYEFIGFVIKAGVLQQIDPLNRLNNKIFLTHMEALNNNKRVLKIDQIKNTEQFKRAEAKILKSFSFYLKDSELVSVETESSKSGKTFTLTYLSKPNLDNIFIFQAYSDANYNVMIKMLKQTADLASFLDGCIVSGGSFRCSACREGYRRNKKDEYCYKQVKNCQLQSGELCLMCAKSYRLLNYSSCT